MDSRRGHVAVEGWARETRAKPASTIAHLAGRGIRRFVFTPVDVDGTLHGPDLDELRELALIAAEAGAKLIYSGGVGSLDDLRAVRAIAPETLEGVIVGRAIYEDRFTVSEGQAVLDG